MARVFPVPVPVRMCDCRSATAACLPASIFPFFRWVRILPGDVWMALGAAACHCATRRRGPARREVDPRRLRLQTRLDSGTRISSSLPRDRDSRLKRGVGPGLRDGRLLLVEEDMGTGPPATASTEQRCKEPRTSRVAFACLPPADADASARPCRILEHSA